MMLRESQNWLWRALLQILTLSYQTLNLVKVIETCISCKVGRTICALYLIAAEEFKRGHVYMALENGKML